MFLCLLESNNAWKKNRAYILGNFFSSTLTSQLCSQFILPFDMSPYKATCLWKYVNSQKFEREKLMIRDNTHAMHTIQSILLWIILRFFPTMVAQFFFAAELLTSSKWVSHHITRTNQMKRTEKIARHALDCWYERENRSDHVYMIFACLEIELPSGFWWQSNDGYLRQWTLNMTHVSIIALKVECDSSLYPCRERVRVRSKIEICAYTKRILSQVLLHDVFAWTTSYVSNEYSSKFIERYISTMPIDLQKRFFFLFVFSPVLIMNRCCKDILSALLRDLCMRLRILMWMIYITSLQSCA